MTKIEYRGRKELCRLTGYRTWKHCRAYLKRLGLLVYDGRTPVLNLRAYEQASLRRHGMVEEGR